MEDALALAACLHEQPDVDAALAAYQAERKPVVESTQRAAQASLEWFENIGMYADQDPAQFVFNLLTRSRRITFENLKDRDAEFAARMEAEFARHQGADDVAPAMFQPIRIGALELKNRVVVSPMDMYCRRATGCPTSSTSSTSGSKALGGAGPGDDGDDVRLAGGPDHARAARGCGTTSSATPGSGSWTSSTSRTTARIGIQLGHSGRKGSTKLMWEGMDEPLDEGNWEVIGPVAAALRRRAATCPARSPARTWTRCVAEFVAAARAGGRGGLRPGRGARRPRLPAVLVPVADLQPAHRRVRRLDGEPAAVPARGLRRRARRGRRTHVPVTVRISATDWMPDGNTEHDAVEIARAFIDARRRGHRRLVGAGLQGREAGVRAVLPDALRRPDPARGRRRRPGSTVIAVGAISSYDDVNSILLAGRADLCALGRTHLYDPQWTLHAAAEQELRRSGGRVAAAVGRRVAAGRPRRAPTRSRRGCRCCATREVPRCMSAGVRTPRRPTQRLASPSAPGAGTDPLPQGVWRRPSARTPGCWPRSA